MQLTFTYEEMAREFRVRVATIRNWKSKGFFKILGYRRLGKWSKQAIVERKEVEELFHKVLAPPDTLTKRRSRSKGK